jgi:ribosomal protein S18 acetylase RimI-like enzyme
MTVQTEGVVVRPARAEDRDTVLAFCANTWEDGDYIDEVWDEWLQASNGQLLVATLDERPVGIINIRMLSKSEAWLEGVRVDANYRRRGIAQAMHIEAVTEAMRRGAEVARLVIDESNIASRSLVERNHMKIVAAFTPFGAGPLAAEDEKRPVSEHTELARLEDLDEIIDYLNNSNVFPTVGGLYYYAFTARAITQELLEEKIARGQVYLLHRWDRLDGLAIAEPRTWGGSQQLSVGYLDGTAIEAISLIAYDLRRRLVDLGREQARVYVPDLMLVQDALSGLEYQQGHAKFFVYERSLV